MKACPLARGGRLIGELSFLSKEAMDNSSETCAEQSSKVDSTTNCTKRHNCKDDREVNNFSYAKERS
jgi:hypothetical protein